MTTTQRFLLALALVAGLVVVTAAGVSAVRGAGSDSPPSPTTVVETTPSEGVTERPWDRERMENATPLPMPTAE